ncbi:DNA replication complex GINS protein PSF3 isoform X2 [Perognathus longimembris pacificus]|uniref:DNA replication complex GINS protein PSF3 isoform X2 n=1 Tax=Perognathus longimembris pacificus TaxID=214514 RepID=UPI002018F45E|nr:DNA replication complex GINS protein PSF3 isoform X2 [Perognathus longimembris pacificus]
MSEAYFRVESGALGPEENFLSLDDILMSQEKLPVLTETPLPRLGAFLRDRAAEPERALPQTFIGRFRRIMDSSQNAYNEDTSALVARLDEMERGLFQTGQKGLNDFQCWEKGQASQITVSNLVQNYKKRKFTDMDD